MEQRVYHGKITPEDFARSLMAQFHRGNLRVQQIGNGDKVSIQIGSSGRPAAGGQTALTVNMQSVEDGVAVQVSEQAWIGVAVSLGATAFSVFQNPLNILNRIDDLAQDFQSLQLRDEVWKTIDTAALSLGSGYELSERIKRYVCEYCDVANPPGEPACIACGAPLGEIQPDTCKNCGYVIHRREAYCPNCGQKVN